MTPRKSTEVRRAEIADAALHIVATRGIAALSTQALADAGGLTTGALFKHFASREAILIGLAERVVELLAATSLTRRCHRWSASPGSPRP